MRGQIKPQEHREGAWSACPTCKLDLGGSDSNYKVYNQCPHCNEGLVPVWWQRGLVALIAVLFAFALPAYFRLAGATLLFAGCFFMLPALMLAHVFFFMAVPPKYVRKGASVTTLFQR